MPPLGRTKLAAIEGIGEAYSGKLKSLGIRTVGALLEKGKTPEGRQALAETTGISGKLILDWINRADVFRIKGISEEYSDLLEATGVDTIPELAQRNPENLLAKLQEVNAEKKLVRRLPTARQVEDWIAQAKELPRKITY